MGGDDARRAAARLQAAADDTRRVADRALAAGTSSWQSAAAARFRRRLAEEVERIRSTAGMLDEAAAAMRRHADALDGALAQALRVARGALW